LVLSVWRLRGMARARVRRKGGLGGAACGEGACAANGGVWGGSAPPAPTSTSPQLLPQPVWSPSINQVRSCTPQRVPNTFLLGLMTVHPTDCCGARPARLSGGESLWVWCGVVLVLVLGCGVGFGCGGVVGLGVGVVWCWCGFWVRIPLVVVRWFGERACAANGGVWG
jgi:hypothetical protein